MSELIRCYMNGFIGGAILSLVVIIIFFIIYLRERIRKTLFLLE